MFVCLFYVLLLVYVCLRFIAATTYSKHKHVMALFPNREIEISGPGTLAGRLTYAEICSEPAEAKFLSIPIRIQ